MIVTVTPNPAIDVTIAMDALPLGESLAVGAAQRRAGGKGLNVARVLAQTGHRVAAAGLVGADDAAWFAGDLAAVDVRLTGCAAPTRSTYALVERQSGRTTQLNERGPARSTAEWDALVAAVAVACGEAGCLAVSGSLPPHSPADAVARLVACGRDAGIPVIADLTGAALRAAAAAGADVLKPNRAELAHTVGTSDPVAGARMLQRHGAGLVLVSLGEDGLVAVPRTGAVHRARLARAVHGNPTGAGDAVVAAVAAAPADDLPTMLRRAVAWSAAAVLAPLAGTLDPAYPDLEPGVLLGVD